MPFRSAVHLWQKRIRMHSNVIRKTFFILTLLLCASGYIAAPIALLAGFVFTLIWAHPFPKLGHKASSLLLKISVVGLGFGMNVHAALESSKEGFWLTIATISITLTLGYFLGRLFGMPRKLSHLVASGTAICGGSAIAAVAPTVNANEKEISVSLGVVFLLNSVALFLFPLLGHWLNLSQAEFGLWSAVAIHDTSSVVGAASAYGEEALKVATTVKLARALWIVPVSLLSAFLFKSKSKKISIPWFIGFFLLAMIGNTYIGAFQTIGPAVFKISKALLVATLFLIGSSLSVAKIREVGYKPIFLGISLWIVISLLALGAVMFWS